MDELPLLYRDLAPWWALLSSPEEYAEEAEQYWEVLVRACGREPATILELGSGGGNNASHLKRHARLTLADLSPAMLGISQALNPECEHVHGDMRTLRLGRTFDAVFVHDAVSYMTSEADLAAVMRIAFEHCRPGGAVLFVPDFVRETFRPGTSTGGHDGTLRALRYLEWTWDPNPSDSTYVMDMAYLLRHEDGSVTAARDRHVLGLFGRADWLRLLDDAGFTATDRPRDDEPGGDLFVGVRPPVPGEQAAVDARGAHAPADPEPEESRPADSAPADAEPEQDEAASPPGSGVPCPP